MWESVGDMVDAPSYCCEPSENFLPKKEVKMNLPRQFGLATIDSCYFQAVADAREEKSAFPVNILCCIQFSYDGFELFD